MTHVLLMVEPVGQRQSRTEAEGREAYARMERWAESLHQRGLLIAAQSLRSQSSASRLQVRAGHTHVLDGPFPETKEVIGGYFFLTVADLDEATEIAKGCPGLSLGVTVEVRPIAPVSPVLEGVHGRGPTTGR